MKKPIGLYCADLHFRDKKPKCFVGNWYDYQKSIMKWLKEQCEMYGVELYCVGDIFDKLKMSNHIVNMAIDNMPKCNTIVGNHDISYVHNLDLVHKSAYGSFIRSETAKQIVKGDGIHPFNFSEKFKHCEDDGFNIALIHELVWETEPFKDAPKNGNVNNLVKRLGGYDLIIAGDNHSWFKTKVGNTTILNCGSVMRLTASQADYQPMVHLLYSDGTFKHIEVPTVELDVSAVEKEKDINNKVKSFANSIISDSVVEDTDFVERLRQTVKVNCVEPEIVELMESYLC